MKKASDIAVLLKFESPYLLFKILTPNNLSHSLEYNNIKLSEGTMHI